MAAPSDSPQDPEPGRVVDPEVLGARRARRTQGTEEGLLERALRAERIGVALEHRLDAAESRLVAAETERGALAADLARAEHDLTAALQREVVEQRLRDQLEGDVGSTTRDQEAEVARLRTEHRAAEERAAELDAALAEARAEAEVSRAHAEAERQAVALAGAEQPEGLRRELDELHALTREMHASLQGERTAREDAERALAAERERSATTVTHLQDELDRRAAVHAAVGAQVAELRAGLEAVKAGVALDGQRAGEARRALAEAVGEQEQLREALEDERRHRLALEALLEVERARFAVEAAGAEGARHAELARLARASDARLAEVVEAADVVRAELAETAAALERDLAAERTAHAAVGRELESERAARRDEVALLTRRLTGRLEVAESALAESQALAAAQRERLVAVEGEYGAQLAAARDELLGERTRAERADAARVALEHELGERLRGEEEVREALAALRDELEAERRETAARSEREAAVEQLVTHLVQTVTSLRSGFEEALAALTAKHQDELTAERTTLAAVEERVAGLRDELATAASELREQLDARAAAEAELAREVAERVAAETRASGALEALGAELERRRDVQGHNPIYDAPAATPLVPPADHPALNRPDQAPPGGVEPPPVVVDLMRAAARLRAEGQEPGLKLVADAPEAEAKEPAAALDVPDAPEAPEALDVPAAPEPATEPAAVDAAVPAPAGLGVLPAAPTREPWFASALTALAAVDSSTAERLLLAALAVQAPRVAKDVAYEIELPLSGVHHVRVRQRDGVIVDSGAARPPADVEFRVTGALAALAPLAAGAAPRRLRDVVVRGRRRRLRRLLRALSSPVGLPELRSAGAQPRAGDLIALLCVGVPVDAVRGEDFGVAYVVEDTAGRRSRTLVRAEPDGSLTAIPEAPELFAADATVTVGADGLLGVLDGTATVAPEGDAQAVTTLHRWLRGVQGLPS